MKELNGFEKIVLAPGESKQLSLLLTEADFSFWDDNQHQCTAEAGFFEVLIGSSSANILLKASVELLKQ